MRLGLAFFLSAGLLAALDLGPPVRRFIWSGEKHEYTLRLETGQSARITLKPSSWRLDLNLEIARPDGEKLLETNPPSASRLAQDLTVIATDAGTYRASVIARQGQGSYEIELEGLQSATAEDHARFDAFRAQSEGLKVYEEGNAIAGRAAVPHFEESLHVWEQAGDLPGQMRTSLYLCMAYRTAQDFEKELTSADRAAELAQRLDDPHSAQSAGYHRAIALYRLGDRSAGIESMRNAAELARALHDQQGTAVALNFTGSMLSNIGDYLEALRYFSRARPVFAKLGEPRLIGSSHLMAGTAQARLGNYKSAIEELREAMTVYEKLHDRNNQGLVHEETAVVYRGLDQPGLATAELEKALSLYREIHRDAAAGSVLTDLALYYARSREFDRAQHAIDDAIAIWNQANAPVDRARTIAALAYLQRLEGKLNDARNSIGQALRVFDAERRKLWREDWRSGFLAAMRPAAETQIAILASGHDETEALLTSEKARATGLVDLLAEAGINGDSRVDSDARPPDIAQIQTQLLRPGAAFIEYFLGDDASYAWAITPGRIEFRILPEKRQIEKTALACYNAMTAYTRGPGQETAQAREKRIIDAHRQFQVASRRLAAMVLEPLAESLQSKQWVVVADGALNYVPFAALPFGGEPAIARHEVSYLPSISALPLLRTNEERRLPGAKIAAVFADPVFDAEDPRVHGGTPQPPNEAVGEYLRALKPGARTLPRLPFTRLEAQAVAAAASPNQITLSLDFTASRQSALASSLSDYRIVHFATHSLANDQVPEASGIVLSLVDRLGQPQEGLLRLSDIYRMRLRADLVVLSACQTAIGREESGRAGFGLTRGFLYAGATRVLASLWKVDDAATSEFMKNFYESLLKDSQSPAAALQNAQQRIRKIKRWQDPYYWAAFVLQGEYL